MSPFGPWVTQASVSRSAPVRQCQADECAVGVVAPPAQQLQVIPELSVDDGGSSVLSTPGGNYEVVSRGRSPLLSLPSLLAPRFKDAGEYGVDRHLARAFRLHALLPPLLAVEGPGHPEAPQRPGRGVPGVPPQGYRLADAHAGEEKECVKDAPVFRKARIREQGLHLFAGEDRGGAPLGILVPLRGRSPFGLS